jgi:hypothetical protein
MKASDLRIGNFIGWYEPNQELLPVKINGIVGQMIYAQVNGTFQRCHENYQSWKPIPLTKEWLLKFGFEKVNNELTNIAPLNLPCTFNLPNTPFNFCQGKLILTTGTGDFCVNTEYVHQLQNLYFALISEELTITKP